MKVIQVGSADELVRRTVLDAVLQSIGGLRRAYSTTPEIVGACAKWDAILSWLLGEPKKS